MKNKEILLVILILISGALFFVKKDKSNLPIVLKKEATSEEIILSLNKKTKQAPDKEQYSVERIKEYKIVKFFYSKQALESTEYLEAIEYKVFFKEKLVLRFNYLKNKNKEESYSFVGKNIEAKKWLDKINTQILQTHQK